MHPISLSFDIGHSSIGWAVLRDLGETPPNHPELLATGVVTFPKDDCLASQRRDRRRTRRHIRSTRQRIDRLKCWLEHRGMLTREELDAKGHPAPFLLAAAALNGVRQLSALELWHVIRWYAHNRGYDGNSRWSNADDDAGEDAEKVKNARQQLTDLGTETMAETVCRLLDLDSQRPDAKISSFLPYKTLNTAYPRSVVTAEVDRILDLHQDQLPGFDALTRTLIFPDRDLPPEERQLLAQTGIKLPKRYCGGLLFGQLVPRFDNRIISRCPITWAEIYQRELDAGQDEAEARRLSERDAKVPAKKSVEFLEYRLARILANLKADGKPLSAACRQAIFQRAQDQGRLSHKDLNELIETHHPGAQSNVHAHFQLHPDAEEALVLDPAIQELQKAKGSRAKLSPFWKFLPESAEAEAVDLWRRQQPVTLAWIVEQTQGTPGEEPLARAIDKAFTKSKKSFADIEDFCQRTQATADWPSGRAPFARPVLRQVKEQVLAGFDPTRSAAEDEDHFGTSKPEDGVLHELSVPDSKTNRLLEKRPLAKLTNNPLVRHRLKILDRLVEDLITEFCPGDPEAKAITTITIEVARELKEFSGKSAKEIAAELSHRHKDFDDAVKYLAQHAPDLPVTGGLIRKCRIAQDLGWHCPFTGRHFDAISLPKMELEHIIPFSKRRTNALQALVLTFPEVNRWKGNRTALQFIENEGSKPVPNRENLEILPKSAYLKRVDALDTKGHPDDQKRKRIRKDLLKVRDFDEREQGFTPGALTQSSHLIKLAMRGLKKRLPHARLHSIPGIATSEIRKRWDLLGTLGHPDLCGKEALRWIETRDRQTGHLITEGHEKFPALTPAPLVEKKKKGQIEQIPHPDSFPCPHEDCEQPLMWPEDHGISQCHYPHCQAILRRVPKPKDEIRDLTHLHHALDAITIALVTHYFPLERFGQNQSGLIWQALVTRNPTQEQRQLLLRTGLFCEHPEPNPKDPAKPRLRVRLNHLDKSIKDQTIARLAETRVVQHIPANRSGSKAELTTWSIVTFDEEKCVILQRPNRGDLKLDPKSRQRKWQDDKISKEAAKLLKEHGHLFTSRQRSLVKRGILKLTSEPINKVLGPNPTNNRNKLRPHGKGRGAIVIEENFGIALDPEPVLIPFHQVQQALLALQKANGGAFPRLLRKGTLIHVPRGTWQGIWRISSVKDSQAYGVSVDLIRPADLKLAKGNARVPQMIVDGLKILNSSLTGRRLSD